MKFWSNSDIPSHGTFVPEKRLLAAVLQRAITDFISGDGELKEGARLWLLEDESCADAPLSFRFICEALDLDLSGLRKAIFMQEQAQTAATTAEAVGANSRASIAQMAISPIVATSLVGGTPGATIVSSGFFPAGRASPSSAASTSIATVVPFKEPAFQEAAL